MDNGNVNLLNYQAEYNYFSISFLPNLPRPEIAKVEFSPWMIDYRALSLTVPYVVAWELQNGSEVDKKVREGYEVIKETGHLKIFRSFSADTLATQLLKK